ncbi:MAG: efflux RND transporter periplasmic adaptor subunit [Bacteroidales bacterium]|nr:efflux RND transporter periplasmic adaptor subunit [Bacteroidales bacterium]
MKNLLKFFLLLLLVQSCTSNRNPESSEQKIPVTSVQLKEKEVVDFIHGSGILNTSKQQKLSFKTGGVIDKIYVKEGDIIKKGQLLAGLNMQEINAQVNKAEEALNKAKRDFERVSNLYNDSVATLEQYQNTKSAAEVAEADLNIAKFNLRYSKITAPSNGRILKQIVEENEIIGPGTPVFLFGSTAGNWVMRVNLTDKDIVQVHIGDSVNVSFDAYPNLIFRAFVSEIPSAADPYTGTFEVEISLLSGNDVRLVAGLIGKADINTGIVNRYVAIPVDAVVNINEMTGDIYELNGNEIIKKNIIFTEISDHEVLVKTGVNPGTIIIYEGVKYINENSKIEIVN